jgi:hypothetical protein
VHSGVLVLAVLKLTLKLELGPEYDSNANRAELIDGMPARDVPTGSFLARTTVRGSLTWRRGLNVLRVSGLFGGKVFFNPAVQDQNTLVGQAGLEDRLRVAPWLELGFAGDYYDAAQQTVFTECSTISCDRHRDFRSGSAVARVSILDSPGELTLTGGYRGFVWKPDPQFDFQAGQATALAAVRIYTGRADREHEIDLTASYHLERRLYNGLQEVNACAPNGLDPSCIQVGAERRADWFHEGFFELTWVRTVLLSAAYGLQVNQSNSFGQSLLRHLVSGKLATRLPWQLYLTVKVQLFVNRSVLLADPVNSQSLTSIEDENRNAFIADLERPIGKTGVAVEARYSVYTNELGSSTTHFLRHVAYLGVSYRVSSR